MKDLAIMKGEKAVEKLYKKNFSMFMVSDFNDQLEKVMNNSPALSGLSRSQALYYIISKLASSGVDVGGPEINLEKEE